MSRSQPGSHTAKSQITEEIPRIRFDSRPSQTRDIVSKLMERHALFPQGGTGLAGGLNLFPQNVAHAIGAETTTTCIGKHDAAIRFGRLLQPVLDDRTGLLGEGYTSGLAAFTHYSNMGTRADGNVLPLESCHFRQAHAGLHRRQEQRVIPTTTPRPRIARGQ